jgi:hypothetical protein
LFLLYRSKPSSANISASAVGLLVEISASRHALSRWMLIALPNSFDNDCDEFRAFDVAAEHRFATGSPIRLPDEMI